MSKINSYIKAVMDKYLIEMAYVEKREGSAIPETVEKKYIEYKADETVDYKTDPKEATIFGYVLGSLVVNRLRSECVDLPNLKFALVPIADAELAHTIQKGPAPKETATV